MRKFQRTAFGIGATVTFVVLLADMLGLFRWLEDWTVDIRLSEARWVAEPPGEQLRLVTIDDASLDTIGRWPWPRARIADALNEVANAGAKVAVFDVLFLEPEQVERGAAAAGATGDTALADAMRRIPTVLAVSVREDKALDPIWTTPKGRRELERFADAAQRGIDRDIGQLVAEAQLVEPYRSRVLDRPAVFKSLAAWVALERAYREGRLPRNQEEFTSRLLGGGADNSVLGKFGESPLIERAWKRGESWRLIEPTLQASAGSRGSPQDLPPIPELAAAGAMFGVVNAEPDRFDGRLRRVTPMFETDFGLAPQLGVAAALAYQGRRIGDVQVAGERLQVAGAQQELRRGKLTIDWPTRSVNFWLTMRAMMSVEPPGGYATITRIGLVG